jgi:cellulose synthase/poly-beta-1,6-N-acetylglucosamine synthase-like glycosyltransferase
MSTPTGRNSSTMTVAVLVPTYRRPADLRRCLAALCAQTRAPDVVIVVRRRDDFVSSHVLAEGWTTLDGLRVVEVDAPGHVHALNSGLAQVDTDVVAITDDDAAPRPEWLARILAHFDAHPEAGGVGGRDWVHHGNQVETGECAVVGRMSRYGRCTGNHHLGAGAVRGVQFLKGANMSYRWTAVGETRFDTRLRGAGAQVCNDMAFSVAVRRKGWTLLYDPRVAVDHYPGVRHDEDKRHQVSYVACFNAAFNQSLVVSESLGRLRSLLFVAWAVLVGTRGEPGLLQMLRLYPTQRAAAWTRSRATIQGVLAGWSAASW